MKIKILRRIVVFLIILTPAVFYQGCKKQPKCGCGKDVIFDLTDAQVIVQYNETSRLAVFYPVINVSGSTYYFCNPGAWIDSLKKLNTNDYLLLSGKAYYECNYLMNSGNSYYQLPPVYQVDVTSIMEDNYGKK
jgi:hypothetical protein